MTGRSVVVGALLWAGCVRSVDPCPQGLEALRSEDRCVAVDRAQVEPDADPLPRAGAVDAGMDGAVGAGEASVGDAQVDAHDGYAAGDAASEGGRPAPGPCSPADVDAWAAFHEDPSLTAKLSVCYAASCAGSSCEPVECVSASAQLAGCSECAWAQASCTLALCGAACTVQRGQKECLACLCEAGCVTAFEACAEQALGVCGDLWGRTATPGEYELALPLLVRAKSQTGGLRVTPIDLHSEADFPLAAEHHPSVGFAHLTAFSLEGRHYLLQHKSRCGSDPCIARIYPVLSSGEFATPVYWEEWTRGWDHSEVFQLAGAAYLLRYKTGVAPADVEPPGQVRIERIALEGGDIVLDAQLEQIWLSSEGKPWAGIRAFAHAGTVQLLLYTTGPKTRLSLRRVQGDGRRLSVAAGAELNWSGGWDVFEPFRLDQRWFLFAYKSGRVPVQQEPAGHARVVAFFADDSGMTLLSPALYDAVWSLGLSHVISYRQAEASYLVVHNQELGDTVVHRIAAEPARWRAELSSPLHVEDWGFRPPWDVVEVVMKDEW